MPAQFDGMPCLAGAGIPSHLTQTSASQHLLSAFNYNTSEHAEAVAAAAGLRSGSKVLAAVLHKVSLCKRGLGVGPAASQVLYLAG